VARAFATGNRPQRVSCSRHIVNLAALATFKYLDSLIGSAEALAGVALSRAPRAADRHQLLFVPAYLLSDLSWRGADVIMGLLGVSVVGTGEVSLASPTGLERLNH
jgi:hypothetical protein